MGRLLFLLMVTCSFLGCAGPRLAMKQHGDRNTAVDNAIEDFLATKYSKDHRVFRLYFQRINLDETTIAFSISDNEDYKIPVTEIDTIGSTRLPTRHLIKNDKLFYWDDPDYGMTEEFLAAITQFDCVVTVAYRDLGGRYFPDNVIDEKKKGVDYFFCKSDLTKYRKVITNRGLGTYKPPKLKCK